MESDSRRSTSASRESNHMLCLRILALNLVDAFATLRHLEHGATEMNPFMLALLTAVRVTS